MSWFNLFSLFQDCDGVIIHFEVFAVDCFKKIALFHEKKKSKTEVADNKRNKNPQIKAKIMLFLLDNI